MSHQHRQRFANAEEKVLRLGATNTKVEPGANQQNERVSGNQNAGKIEWHLILLPSEEFLESVMATDPETAWLDSTVDNKHAVVCRPGERGGGWHPGMGNGKMYAGFRAAGFSHSDCAAALDELDYSYAPVKRRGTLSERQAAYVAVVKAMDEPHRFAWADKAAEVGALREAAIHAQVCSEIAFERLSKWLKNPTTAEEERASFMRAIEEDENEGRVAGLSNDEAVSVCYGRDGISDDCATVSVADLVRAGYGGLRVECEETNPTCWVSRRKFEEIAAAC